MNKQLLKFVSALLLGLFLTTQYVYSDPIKGFTVRLDVKEKGTKNPIYMASCVLQPLQLLATTDIGGKAQLSNIPTGVYQLEVSYLGFESYKMQLKVEKDLELNVLLQESSLALNEVVVTAQQSTSGVSTSSKIGRRAIDHLQATSLADVMQLLPGYKMGNADFLQKQNIQMRSLSNDNTAAFGGQIIVDGIPMSNNGAVSQGQFSGSAFVGTDLRQVSVDDIDNVEVVRGIPSAEYGDLTSGMVVVHSKVGVSPFQIKGKINPALQNYSLGKGFHLNKLGILNINADYAKAWSDPRMKTRSYDRYTLNMGYGYQLSKRWNTNTRLRVMYMEDSNGKDPDAIQDGTYNKSTNLAIALSHNGKINVNKPLMRRLDYTIGITTSTQKSDISSYVSSSSGLIPIITATESGYFAVPYYTQSYLGHGITESKPLNIFAKVGNQFFAKGDKTYHAFKVGAEYKYDHNNGVGYYNVDETHPLRPNSDGRPRNFSTIPALNQLSAYAEDNFSWNINKVNVLRAQVGLRLTSLQPFSNMALTALSPRVNVSFDATKWLKLRMGIGLNSKTPGLDYLYPDKKYSDRVAANYLSTTDPITNILYYNTQVFDVQRSYNIKNATTTKIEAGFDLRLKGGRKLSFLAYYDKTPNGFGALTNYTIYNANVYDATQGLTITPGVATQIDLNNPARVDKVFMTTGEIGNTSSAVNKGVEFDFDLGEIKPLRTTLFFSGAYSESKSWDNDEYTSSVRSALLPVRYTSYGLTPIKVIYPAAIDYTLYRRFLTTLRVVTNIPALKMVASLTTQVIWHDYSLSYSGNKQATGWIDEQLKRNAITNDMRDGYIGFDGVYYASKPTTNDVVKISDLDIRESDQQPSKQPITWNMAFRLTKELSKAVGFSLYVNNSFFYEPFLKNNKSSTLVQRNTGTFGYGVEFFFNL